MYVNILEGAECNYNCWDIEVNYIYTYTHIYILRIWDTIWNQIIPVMLTESQIINRSTFGIFPDLRVPDVVWIKAEKC